MAVVHSSREGLRLSLDAHPEAISGLILSRADNLNGRDPIVEVAQVYALERFPVVGVFAINRFLVPNHAIVFVSSQGVASWHRH